MSDWSVYRDTGELCDTMAAVTTVKEPYLESCLEFCENYIMEFCMVETKENKGDCMASAKCDSFRPSNVPKYSYIIYRGPAYRGRDDSFSYLVYILNCSWPYEGGGGGGA
jgi:hypothetical protein